MEDDEQDKPVKSIDNEIESDKSDKLKDGLEENSDENMGKNSRDGIKENSDEEIKENSDEEIKENSNEEIKENIKEEENSPSDLLRFCPNCGKPIKWAPKTYYCNYCGTLILKYIPESKWELWLAEKIDSSRIDLKQNLPIKPAVATPEDEQTEYLKRFLVKKRRVRKNTWNAKNAIIAPLVAVFGKFGVLILLLIGIILFRVISIEQIASMSSSTTQILTLIDFATQYIFIAVAFYFLRKNLGSDVKPAEVFSHLGLPFNKIKFYFKKKSFNKRDIENVKTTINSTEDAEESKGTENIEDIEESRGTENIEDAEESKIIDEIKEINALKEILIGLLIGIIMYGLIMGLQIVSYEFVKWIWGDSIDTMVNENSTMGVVPPSNVWILITIITIQFIIIAPSEEILFRGYAQKGFIRSWGKQAGLIATAFYFSLFHIIFYILIPEFFMFLFIPYMCLSLVLGYLYQKRGNLIAPIIAHALYNSIQFFILYSI